MSRWTDLAVWHGLPSNNFGDGDYVELETADAMSEHRGLVVHIAAGTYAGTISWEKNPNSDVSSHFVVGRDGRCAQMVDTHDRSWCQRTGNSGWLSVECEGQLPQSLTGQQIEVIAQLLVRAHREYGVPIQATSSPTGRGLGYHSMGGTAWGHLACPGPAIIAQIPAIVARAQQLAGTTTEDDMDLSDQVTGTATPDHANNRTVAEILGDVWGLLAHGRTLGGDRPGTGTYTDSPLAPDAPPTVTLTSEQVVALASPIAETVLAGLDARIEATVRRVLGSLDATA